MNYHKITLKSGPRFKKVVIEGNKLPAVGVMVRIKGEGDRVWSISKIQPAAPLCLERVQ
jgi:hypothetical protein